VVPYAGYGINFMRGRIFHTISVFLIPAFMAFFVIRKIWRTRDEA